MSALSPLLRRQLERAVLAARTAAETGARKALGALGVDQDKPPRHLTSTQVELHRRLRAQAHMLGDGKDLKHLIEKIAYDHWHRLLFSRFLLENHMLLHPEHRVPLEFQDIVDLATEAGICEPWDLAARYTASVLPAIFRPDDPVGDISLPSEDRGELLRLLKELPTEIFQADDSLGWVYQFWRAAEKDAVNKSGDKINGDTLGAVTQLFTEHYMVEFLLYNTLGAWWAAKHHAKLKGMKSEAECRMAIALPGVNWEYLRFIKDENTGEWQAAAGTFDGWPKTVRDLRMLDPCCGSGHFLVVLLQLLVAMLRGEEKLGVEEAVRVVLGEILHGLEIDARCTQLAAFNLAFAAWKLIGRPVELPPLRIACSGLSVGATRDEWLAAVEDKEARFLIGQLYDLFKKAPELGSLINPARVSNIGRKATDLLPAVRELLAADALANPERHELGITAKGLADAAEILGNTFDLIATNVPYLGRGKQNEELKDYCERNHRDAKADLSTCFVERCLSFCKFGNGTTALVTPQNWLFLGTYKKLRERLFHDATWNVVAKLGPAAFQDMNWWAANTVLFAITNQQPSDSWQIAGLDVSTPRDPQEKAILLKRTEVTLVSQAAQLTNPDARLLLTLLDSLPLLENYAVGLQGISPADYPHYGRFFWELTSFTRWRWWQSTIDETAPYGGRELVLWWNEDLKTAVEEGSAFIRGEAAWGKCGVVVRQMRHLPCCIYTGEAFDTNCAAIVPDDQAHVPAVWAFCSSEDFAPTVRQIDQKTNVTNSTLVKVPFDLTHWQHVAAEKYPNGLPRPHSDDPTQWLFNGHPRGSDHPLQVGVARLLGYRWPRQTGSAFPDCPVLESDGLEAFADEDGVVCVNAIKGENPAAERLQELLAAAFGRDWSAAKLSELLAPSDARSLEDWLRNHFFEEHCAIFHQRPFLWQIWDGRKDGFSAIVNYHRLDRARLEKLTYAYLGDWLRRQQAAKEAGEAGSDARHQAAVELQTKLKLIIEGEAPYDIFVRWKPIDKQPLGWEPDLNDGVRLNIRPFVTADILRKRPNINWRKDRGKDVTSAPWYDVFEGERINDHHLTLEEKRAARLQADTSSVGDAAALAH